MSELAAVAAKADIWREVHRERVPCPRCGKVVTRRTLRWKHVCGVGRRVLLESGRAEERRQELQVQSMRDLLRRLDLIAGFPGVPQAYELG